MIEVLLVRHLVLLGSDESWVILLSTSSYLPKKGSTINLFKILIGFLYVFINITIYICIYLFYKNYDFH